MSIPISQFIPPTLPPVSTYLFSHLRLYSCPGNRFILPIFFFLTWISWRWLPFSPASDHLFTFASRSMLRNGVISGDEGYVCVWGHPDFGEEETDSASLWFPRSHLSQAAAECQMWDALPPSSLVLRERRVLMVAEAVNTHVCQSLQGLLLNTCSWLSELDKFEILTSYIHLFLLKLGFPPLFLIRPMVNKDAQFFPYSHLLTIFFIICFVFLPWVLCHFPVLIFFFPNVQSDAWFSILNELEFLSHVLKAQYQILIHQLYFLFLVRYSTWVKIICPANPQLAAFSGTCKQQSNTVQKWLLLLSSLTFAFLSVRQPPGGSLLSSPVPPDTWSMTQILLVEAYVD